MSPELRAAISRIQERLVPEKGTLRAAYLDEAAAAKRHRGELPSLEADLRKFPIPEGQTLYDVAEAFELAVEFHRGEERAAG